MWITSPTHHPTCCTQADDVQMKDQQLLIATEVIEEFKICGFFIYSTIYERQQFPDSQKSKQEQALTYRRGLSPSLVPDTIIW